MKLIVWLLAVLTTMLAACGGNTNNGVVPTSTPFPTAPAVARPTYVVQRGTVQNDLSFTGRWQPRDQLALAFPLDGTVRQVNVRRGDRISDGQLLADYQIEDLENQLITAELDLETAIANMVSGEEGGAETIENLMIAVAEARLSLEETRASRDWSSAANARVSLDDAQRELDNAQRAYDDTVSRSASTASQIDAAYERLQSAQSNLDRARNNYYSAGQSYNNYTYRIQQSENALAKAELELQRALESGGDPSQVQALRQAQLRVDQLREQIAQSSLYSPLDGVVLEVTIRSGDSVRAYETVISVGLLEPKEIIANLGFSDTQNLSVGLVGVCQVINQPETAVQCAVRQIPLSNRDADQSTRVVASLPGVPDNQLIEVRMPLEVRENVLWLPPAAVRTFQNRTFVVLQTPAGPRSVDIEIGLQTQDRIEIRSGVEEGDVVVGP